MYTETIFFNYRITSHDGINYDIVNMLNTDNSLVVELTTKGKRIESYSTKSGYSIAYTTKAKVLLCGTDFTGNFSFKGTKKKTLKTLARMLEDNSIYQAVIATTLDKLDTNGASELSLMECDNEDYRLKLKNLVHLLNQ
jgi:hypothetical protein